jgi:DNA-binding XRE family transcriptional regulator
MIEHEKIAPIVVATWREQMGYTQYDAAHELGCSRKSLINWEKGRNRIPRYIALAMGALAMGMAPYGARLPRKRKAAAKAI